ncbi:MAG: response regulator, partial [Candidatus Hydrogenedentota bacterium]
MDTKKQSVIFTLEDEKEISDLITLHLERAGFFVEDFDSVKDFRQFLNRRIPDIAILDIMLPDGDGLELCKELRSNPRTKSIGIILLTARAHESDKVLGLEYSDDYITKPFSPRELVARVKALLRRLDKLENEKKTFTGLKIDPNKRQVLVDGRKIELTTTEFSLLELLTSKPEWVFPRDQILDMVWGRDKAVTDRTVDVHIS